METIIKILYSTDSKREIKKDNLLRSSQLNDFQKLKGLFNKKININKKDNSPLTLDKNNINNKNNLNNYAYIKKSNQKSENKNIDKDILNKINKELTFNTKKTPLKSMKYLNNNNYDYDLENIDNSLNLSEEFKNIINEKEIIKTNNIYNNNNNNYTVRKIHNNINININNNKTDNNNIDHKSNNNRYNNIDMDTNLIKIY